jgi:hypothetical protein
MIATCATLGPSRTEWKRPPLTPTLWGTLCIWVYCSVPVILCRTVHSLSSLLQTSRHVRECSSGVLVDAGCFFKISLAGVIKGKTNTKHTRFLINRASQLWMLKSACDCHNFVCTSPKTKPRHLPQDAVVWPQSYVVPELCDGSCNSCAGGAVNQPEDMGNF